MEEKNQTGGRGKIWEGRLKKKLVGNAKLKLGQKLIKNKNQKKKLPGPSFITNTICIYIYINMKILHNGIK